MGYAAYAKYLGGSYLSNLNVASLYNGNWGKRACDTGLENLKPVCEYTEGFVAMEYFLSKFGFEGLISLLSDPGSPDFQTRFQAATKESLATFYLDANTYIKAQGWASTWSN